MRKKLWMALAGCVLLGVSGCGSSAPETVEEVQNDASEHTEEQKEEDADTLSWYGTWVVTEAKPAETGALSEEEYSGMIGNTVTYEEHSVQINEDQLEIEGYETMQDIYTPDSLKEDYPADLSDWEEGVQSLSFVEVLNAEDMEFFGDTFFITDTGELWIYREGVFFRTEKAE